MAPGWCQISEPSESTTWGADETYRHISAAAPAFLLSLRGIRFLPAKPFALSFQPLVKQVLWRQRERASSCFVSWHRWLNRRIRWGRLWRKLSYSVLLLPPFSTRASVSPHLTLHQHHHAIGPIPRFHLISVACSTGFGKICSTRLEKTINITKLSWSITLYHCIPLQKVEFFIQRVNDARMLVALGDWWNLYLFAACQSPGWSMSLMFNS